MADGSRADLRRVGYEQLKSYKRNLIFVVFLIAILTMITTTFLNPIFMKQQIRTSNNRAIVVRQINSHFDTLADLIGAEHEDNANLLTIQQTQPIADHIIDYSLGFHWFKVNNTKLANQVLHDINLNIDKGSSSEAQRVQSKLKKQGDNAVYAVIQAFDLNIVTLGANIAIILLLVNIVIVIVTIITLFSLLNDLHSRTNTKMVIHIATAAGMWAGFWMILIFGILAIIPVIFNVETLPLAGLGYLMEISSSIFLEYVIVGVVIYVLCAIPWQATANNS